MPVPIILPYMRKALIAATLLLVGGCATSEANLAVIASAPNALGTGVEQRILVGLVDPETGESLASPETPASVTLVGPGQVEAELGAEFLWTIEGLRGLYVTHYEFPSPGEWSIRLHPEGLASTPATLFQVGLQASVPEVGEEAPVIASRTAADYPLEEITTDDSPDPSFYELSLDQALTNGLPSMVVFATPAFCESQTCGPLLDQVKALAPSHPGINFLHVEIYENLDAPSLDELVVVEAVTTWGLPSEPWVFVVDGTGVITARFEGAASDEELTEALVEVTS